MQKMLLLVLALLLALTPQGRAEKNHQLKINFISQTSAGASARPVYSSLSGGTLVYIKPVGHSTDQGQNKVYVGNFECIIPPGGVSDSFIVCQTSDSGSSTDLGSLPVTLISNGRSTTTSSPDIVYYLSSYTPTINQVFPSVGFAGTTAYLYGAPRVSDAGNGRETGDIKEVKFGDSQCSLMDVTQDNFYTYIKCIQSSSQQAGNYNISEKVTYGKAMNSASLRRASLQQNSYFQFTVLPTITSISQNNGEEGGQRLTIQGTGFSKREKNNSVSIDGNDCQIEQVKNNSIKCTLKSKDGNFFAKLPTNSSNQLNGYFAGAGLNYMRFSSRSFSTSQFASLIRANSFGAIGTILEKGFRAELRQYNYQTSYTSQHWNGYFTAPVNGTYTFRGYSDYQFAMYLSNVTGSTEPAATPLIYSDVQTTEWTNFYYDDIATAENSVNLTAGMSYYLQAYHINSYNNQFKIAVDVPNADNTLPFQTYEVHKLLLNATLQPEVIVYTMVGGSGGSIDLMLVRTDKYGKIVYNTNKTISYACSADEFLGALYYFDSFYPYKPSVVRNVYDSKGNLTNTTFNASKIQYVVSVYLVRNSIYQTENFIVTRLGFSGNFTKKVQSQHSPLISGNFSFTIGGVSLNSGTLSYTIAPATLQSYFRTIKGFEKVQVELNTIDGCGYYCTWIISYKGVNAAIPKVVVSASNLAGGSSAPTVINIIRRPYSSSITFEPIDYRFLNTYSNLPNVQVTTNGLPAVCTGNCSYAFMKVATIKTLSFVNPTLTLSFQNTSSLNINTTSSASITINDVPCIIFSNSTLNNFKCSIASVNGTAPLSAGVATIVVYIKPYGIIQLATGLSPLTIPLVVSSVSSTSGGSNGGSINRFVGSGFSPYISLISIVVCDKYATIISSTYSQINFYMPSCTKSGSQTFTLTIGAIKDTSKVYNYIAASGPKISTLTPNSSNPAVKTTLSINGTGFGTNQSAVQVYLANAAGKIYQLKVLSFSSTYIKVGLSGGKPGNYTVQVTLLSGGGDSEPATLGADSFSYSLTITSVTPATGSYNGGTLLTIKGTNFSPASRDTIVYVGYSLNWFCNIISINSTQITCRTPAISREYSANETLEVSVSTKLIIMNTCPNSNCNFVYMDQTLSPILNNISITSVTNQNVTLDGTNFQSNPNDTCTVVLGAADPTQDIVVTPIYCNQTSAQFKVPSTVSTGSYNVKIRNSIGESNFKTLKVEWTPGNLDLQQGSTEGAIISTYGGSNYPTSLGGFNYITLTNPFPNKQYDVNIISCCGNNTLSFAVPPLANGAYFYINFITPTQTLTLSYYAYSIYTPKLNLTSKQVVNPGLNSISVIRSDTLSSVLIKSIQMVSTIDNTNIIAISNWTTTNISTYTFSATLFSGSYKIVVLTNYGYCTVNSTINVAMANGSSILSKKVSFAGDFVTLTGSSLSPSSYITVNGFKGVISSYSSSTITYKVPALSSPTSQASYSLNSVSHIDSSLFGTFSDSNSSDSNHTAAIDKDTSTIYGSTNKDCWVGIDVGDGLQAFLDRIHFFPMIDWSNVANYILEAVFEASNDKSTWIAIGKLDQSIHIGWNNLPIPTNIPYRYIRFRHNSTSQCNLAEIQLQGIIYSNQSVSLTSQLANVTYNDGYNTISFKNVIEFRSDRTPIVQLVSPQYGDVFGGYQLTITGSNLNFSTQAIVIDGVSCAVTSSNDTQINCTVGARPNILPTPTFTVTIGTSQAVIKQTFLYVLKWSDSRTWGVDLPPIDGDLVYVPPGMTLLVDQDTPQLEGIAVQNGTLLFPNNIDITVRTGFITMNGGSFIAGTEAQPLQSNLNIILYGDYYGAQQPVFGNKVIGCLDCQFSMYGRSRSYTWTTIASSISPGDTSLTVKDNVDWQVGEAIVVASTSFLHTEAEEKSIVAINGSTIVVDTPFEYLHVSTSELYGTSDRLEMHAEVGLLSRNIKIMGDNSSSISQYGSHLLITRTLSNNLEAKIGYTQFLQCGQPQIPGRYCIYFDNAKSVPTSYVRGNSVHDSFARMIAVESTSYLTVEQNVGYLNKGHNIFLPTGTETYNVIRYNLVISSLIAANMLLSDYSVASYYITHPTNDFYGNHAAGSDYYGVLYLIDNKAQSGDICPIGNRLGLVANNVIHSNMFFGLRIYKLYSRLYPCSAIRNDANANNPWAANPSIPSIFHNFTIYKNLVKGVLAQQIGNLMLNNFTVAENYIAAVQFEVANFTQEMVSINNSIIIGQSTSYSIDNSTGYYNMYGVVTPRTGQSNVTNVRFYNYPSYTYALVTCSQCNNYLYLTNLGNQIFIKNIKFSGIAGSYLQMLGVLKDVIYDLDGSLSSYFFNATQSSGTIVYGYNHIINSHPLVCKHPLTGNWNGMIMCDPSITIRRIFFTNIIGAVNYWDFMWGDMNVLPITNVTQIMNSSNIDPSKLTTTSLTNSQTEKYYAWSLPFVTGEQYQVWWGNTLDYTHLSISTTPLYSESDKGVVFKLPYVLNRQLYQVGPMRGFIFPNSSLIVPESLHIPDPLTCINGQYHHNNDVGPSRMLSICQSGKNKTKFQYTEVNSVYCKYVCPIPPAPLENSSAGIVIKESFIRIWSNASQWPNGKIPGVMENVTVNANWTILLDMDPNPANYMIIDGTVIAEDTRDVVITAKSIHIRAGNISAGSAQSPFTHNFLIRINNTQDSSPWTIDPIIRGNKFIVVTGSLNLFGTPPSSVSTYLTQTASTSDSKIFVADHGGWSVGDSITLSPSYGIYSQFETVTISGFNTDGSLSISPKLMYNHYGSYQVISSDHGSVDVNTYVGHLTRNIKILSGPDYYQYGPNIIVYSYYDIRSHRIGSLSLSGVQIDGAGQPGTSSIQFLNVLNGAASSITSSSISNCISSCLSITNSNTITFSNNVFYNSSDFGVDISSVQKLTFTNNLLTGMTGGCLSTYNYINPTTDAVSIENNYCLGSSSYGFIFPFILCDQLEINPMANNTAGSCQVGFIFNNIESNDICKAFSYIKAYACTIGQISNPMDTSQLNFEHFILADNQRGATLKFGDSQADVEHIALFSYSYITAISRPTCTYCYGSNAIPCSNNLGLRMLSVSGDGEILPTENELNFDSLVTAEVFDSKAFLTSVLFDNFQQNYSALPQCSSNFVFRPHPDAHDAVGVHSLFDCSCSNCDNNSYLLADGNDLSQVGWHAGCGEIPCTGRSNYLVIDWNGTFLGYIGTIIPNNPAIGQHESLCTYSTKMNAYLCNRTDFAVLGYQSKADDYNTRVMWPVNLTYDGANYSSIINGWREWDWNNGLPVNHRLGRFLSITKLNSTYNMTFTSMAPLHMQFLIEKRDTTGNQSNFVIVKIKYPLPNMIRIYANDVMIDPILLTDTGLRRKINTSNCGDNIYYYTNYTTNFVVTEGNCFVKLELVETIQLTTHFAMTPDQFFQNTVMSNYIDNLCALLSITDTSRVKIVGVYTGSTIVQAMILPASNLTDNSSSASNSSANSTTDPSLATVQQTINQIIQSGVYSSSMLNATGFQVLSSTSSYFPITNNATETSTSNSLPLLIGGIVGGVAAIIVIILTVLYCIRNKGVEEDVNDEKYVHQEKEIIGSDSIVFSNESSEKIEEEIVVERDHKNRKNRVTNNMRRNRRKAKENNNLQVKELNIEYYDFEQ